MSVFVIVSCVYSTCIFFNTFVLLDDTRYDPGQLLACHHPIELSPAHLSQSLHLQLAISVDLTAAEDHFEFVVAVRQIRAYLVVSIASDTRPQHKRQETEPIEEHRSYFDLARVSVQIGSQVNLFFAIQGESELN